ncbi:ADP-ribosylation factor-like protein 6-interacting protein 6 [Anoplopoma fimbria]|uniref:ADP-ribosylation factor-like protein 6-interacting protein 6 n=1 Tax=Anoplopoma fimbria TaxID=229290 RepID=UPI0023EAC78B|nr:ADP-ribosylation factor-like protein 6-interacting protein 6 [Anoplopoma fimbria]
MSLCAVFAEVRLINKDKRRRERRHVPTPPHLYTSTLYTSTALHNITHGRGHGHGEQSGGRGHGEHGRRAWWSEGRVARGPAGGPAGGPGGRRGAVSAVGCVCALIYPILTELRAERVMGEDRTEERLLGFWSILVLSVLVGCICCVFSWTITYLDSYQPARLLGSPPPTLDHMRDGWMDHGFHMGYGVAVMNGIMAMLTVTWSLT